MTNLTKTFTKSESGAVTVDWVVLTAAFVTLGFVVMAIVTTGVEDLSVSVAAELTERETNLAPFATNNADIAAND